MSGPHDATGRRCRGGVWRTRSRVGVTARQVVATHSVAEVELVRPDNKSSGGARSSRTARRSNQAHDKSQCDRPTRSRAARRCVVDDEPRDVPKHPDARCG
jgi:hypothetical protein